MKSKKNSTNGVFFILIVMVIFVVFLAMLQRQDNKQKQMTKEFEKKEYDLSWKVLSSWAKVDSLDSVLVHKDTLIFRLEDQKKILQSEIYRLQPYVLQLLDCKDDILVKEVVIQRLQRELSQLRDSITKSNQFEVAIPDSVISLFRDAAEDIRVFPTVFEEHLLVTANIDLKARVSNIAGYLVKQVSIPSGDKMRINTSEIKTGVYFVSFYASYEGQERLLKTERVIKR